METFVLTMFWLYIAAIIVNALSMLPENSVNPIELIATFFQIGMAIWAGVLLWG